ncbi:hypothetical protein AOA81_06250 [Methanomassiliicoccales archaeon RumEn M2]|nr:hypothetical protein AOA81_06250 [Methanomassiliicoccales archaeon RumEn M2]
MDRFGRWCFYNNGSLSDVHLNKVKTIGDWAFAYCDCITTITLPDTVSYIGMNAFRYCNELKSIIIESDNPIEFGANAFYSTHPSKSFYVPENLLDRYYKMKIWRDFASALKTMKGQSVPKDSS